MSEYRAYADVPRRALPDSVRTLRVLLYVWAALTLLITVGLLVSQAITAEVIGTLIWTIWPGVVAAVVARRIQNGGRKRFWWTVVAGTFGVLGALAAIGGGDPRGVTQLILPVAVLITVTRATAQAFFRD